MCLYERKKRNYFIWKLSYKIINKLKRHQLADLFGRNVITEVNIFTNYVKYGKINKNLIFKLIQGRNI